MHTQILAQNAKKSAIIVVATVVALLGVKYAEAQFISPTCVPPNCNPQVIQNIPLTDTAQDADFNITGDGGIGNELQIGTQSPVLSNATDNLIFANISGSSTAGSLLLLQSGGADILRVDLNGKMTAAGPASHPAGSAATPSYSFASDANTGIFNASADAIGFSTGGANRLTVNNSGVTTTTKFFTPLGTAAAPVFSFTGDTNTGLYSPGGDTIAFTTAGSEAMRINPDNSVTFAGAVSLPGGISGDGSGVTNIDGSNIVNGDAISSLNATNLTTGTVAVARLPAAVAYTNVANNFTSDQRFTGNVGVGVAPNASPFYLNDTGATAGNNGMQLCNGACSHVFWGTTKDWYIRPGNTTSGRIIIADSGGLVGIGTASPSASYKLDVVGNTRVTGNLDVTGTITGGGLASADGTTNTLAKFTGSSVLGDSLITDDGTNVGIGSIVQVFQGGSILSQTDNGGGATIPDAEGWMMLWNVDNAAFRAGYNRANGDVTGNGWDNANRAWASAAFGDGTVASGRGAFAFGEDTSAIQDYGFAGGQSTLASGGWSVALGRNTTASGNDSMAVGRNTVASGNGSFAGGNFNVSDGFGSFAYGDSVSATGDQSLAFGLAIETTGNDAYTFGVSSGGSLSNDESQSFVVGFMDGARPSMIIRGKDARNGTTSSFPSTKHLFTIMGQENPIGVAIEENHDVFFDLDRTTNFFGGALANQRAVYMTAPTYAAPSAMTITDAATVAISGAPVAGANTTLTNSYALLVESGNTKLDGDLDVTGTITGGGLASAVGTTNTVPKFTGSSALGDSLITDDGTNVGVGSSAIAARLGVAPATNQEGVRIETSNYSPLVIANGAADKLFRVYQDGSLISEPSGSSAWPVGDGDGMRMAWIGDLGAFRAGYSWSNSEVTGSAWDGANLGQGSAAFGNATVAKGQFSFAAGENAAATGQRAFAVNGYTVASGGGSAAFGWFTKATGSQAFTFGESSTVGAASGENSLAGGFDTLASGQVSVALGGTTVAAGTASLAFGTCVEAHGYNSYTFGETPCGSRLINDEEESLVVGFNSATRPTMIVRGNDNPGTASTSSFPSTTHLFTIMGQTNSGTGGPTAGVEAHDIFFDLNRTNNLSAGALANQRAVYIGAPTYAFSGASTITNAATVAIEGAPAAGTNATLTNSYALLVESGNTKLDGDLEITGTCTGCGGTISGTTNFIPKFTASDALGNSSISDTGSAISIANDVTALDLVRVCDGACGTQDFANAAGDLYVENDIDVDGTIRAAYMGLGGSPLSGYGISSQGTTGGGIFVDTDNGTSASVAAGTWGFHTNNNSYVGGTLTVNSTSGIGAGGQAPTAGYGIYAKGSTMGGRFYDSNGSAVAYAGYGSYGLYGWGSTYGARGDGSTYGIWGRGTSAGGFFEDSNNTTSNVKLAYGSYGVYAFGSAYGGYFKSQSSGLFTYLDYSSYGVYTNGNAVKLNGGSWVTYSDRRLKKDIQPYSDGLETIRKLDPVSFKWNGLGDTTEGDEGISFIAQDVAETIPYMIETHSLKLHPDDAEETELYMLNPSTMPFLNLNAIKELDVKIVDLEAQVAEIQEVKDSVEVLEEKMKALEERIEELEDQLN